MVIAWQHRNNSKRTRELTAVSEKLQSILDADTREMLLLLTDDKALISLLNQINRLLDLNQKIRLDYTRSEISTKRLVSNISHDLKTPLTVVMGYLEALTLDENRSKEERAKLLENVQGKARELLDLINRFFDLIKLESGDREIPLTRVNLNEVCRKSLLLFYDAITVKGLEADINIPSETLFVRGNEDALERILNNLLSNAVKYGSDGGYIGIGLHSDEKFAYIHVRDKGKGIQEQDQRLIFDRLYTLEDSRNKLYQGSGLGLTISKALAEKCDGEIYVTSVPYKETVFTVKLIRITF